MTNARRSSDLRRGVIFLAMLGTVTLAAIAWVKVPLVYPQVPSSGQPAIEAAREAARVQAIVTTRASVLAALAGLGAIVTIWINYKNSRTAIATLQETTRAYRQTEEDRSRDIAQRESEAATNKLDATERRITDLYTKAVDQLGSERAPVRLGGLYALERLAQDVPNQRQTIVNVICAYLRMPFEPPSLTTEHDKAAVDRPHAREGGERDARGELEVRSAAQRILGAHLRFERLLESDISVHWPNIDLDLKDAVLVDVDFEDCSVASAVFRGATFLGDTVFRDCRISGVADFSHAEFDSMTNFDSSVFGSNATFNEFCASGPVYFTGSVFSAGLSMDFADVNTVNFDEAEFGAKSSFFGTKVRRAIDFEGAHFAVRPTFNYMRLLRRMSALDNILPGGWEISTEPDSEGFFTVQGTLT